MKNELTAVATGTDKDALIEWLTNFRLGSIAKRSGQASIAPYSETDGSLQWHHDTGSWSSLFPGIAIAGGSRRRPPIRPNPSAGASSVVKSPTRTTTRPRGSSVPNRQRRPASRSPVET